MIGLRELARVVDVVLAVAVQGSDYGLRPRHSLLKCGRHIGNLHMGSFLTPSLHLSLS